MANDFSQDDTCIAQWRFENGALTVDSKGTNTLTAHGSPAADTSDFKEGAASVILVKTSSQYFSRTDTDLSTGFPFKYGDTKKQGSFLGWWKPGSGAGYLWSKRYNSSSTTTFSLSRTSQKVLAIAWNTSGYYPFSSVSYSPYYYGYPLEDNEWYFIALVLDGVNKTIYLRVYRDSTGEIFEYNETPSTTLNLFNNAPFYIGDNGSGTYANARADLNLAFNRLLLPGEIDLIRQGRYTGAEVPLTFVPQASYYPHTDATFQFDDDFESGDKSAWDTSDAAATVVTGSGMSGTYAALLTDYTAYLKKDVEGYKQQIMVDLDVKSTDVNNSGNLIGFLAGAGYTIGTLWGMDWDGDNFYIEVHKGAYGEAGSGTGLGGLYALVPYSAVSHIRMFYLPDPVNGIAQVWVGNDLVIDFAGNTGRAEPIASIVLGDVNGAGSGSYGAYFDNVSMTDALISVISGTAGLVAGCSLFPVYDISTGTPDLIPGTSSAYLNIQNNIVSTEEVINTISGLLGLVVGGGGSLVSGRTVINVISGTSGLKAGSGGNLQTTITTEVTAETDIPGWSGLRLGIPAYAGLKSIFSAEEVTASVVINGVNGLAAGIRAYLSSAPPVGPSTVDIPGTLGLVAGCSLWAPRLPQPSATDIPCVNGLRLGSLAGLVSNLITAVIIPGESGLLVGVELVEAGDYEAWVLTGNGFNPSAYTGWRFNSFAKYQGRYYAAGPDGLYLLEGPTQDGDEIISGVRLYADFGTQRKKWIRAMRLGTTGDEVEVRIASEDKEGYFELQGDRVVGSYVLRGHNLTIDIQHFDELSHVEIVPMILVAK